MHAKSAIPCCRVRYEIMRGAVRNCSVGGGGHYLGATVALQSGRFVTRHALMLRPAIRSMVWDVPRRHKVGHTTVARFWCV
jgi:hypothetical protein